MTIPRYIMLDKKVGETPLSCALAWQASHPQFATLPLAYAGRLDPMASGRLLILLGDECKQQAEYHNLDKEYQFSVLFGVGSDTGDVLGRLSLTDAKPVVDAAALRGAAASLCGRISLPFPHFSSKTIKGKPLHTWALEGRLNEITIPVQTSTVHKLTLTNIEVKTRSEIYTQASAKIETIPPVTDPRKALGNDFRRSDIRKDWQMFTRTGKPTDTFTIAHFTASASSGTYMRSLAEELGRLLSTKALAYHIHRTIIGRYVPLPLSFGIWKKRY